MSKETEAQDWLRVRVALAAYMSNNLPDGLRFDDIVDFRECVLSVIDDLVEEDIQRNPRIMFMREVSA